MDWQPLLGRYTVTLEGILFHGEVVPFREAPGPALGNLISSQRLSAGTVSARVRFESVSDYSACDILLAYQPDHPSGPAFLTAGLGAGGLFSVRGFIGSWQHLASAGDRSNLKSGLDYTVSVSLAGSHLALTVDNVEVIRTTLPIVPPEGQVGVWCSDVSPIHIAGFNVSPRRPRAFVVMQYSKPYNELFSEVLSPVCESEGVDAERADDVAGPGMILTDIARQISDAHFVVAEITPTNPNVYYEVGYAHALNKPTILVAEHGTQLPFDVSPFRTLFYENTIEGKRRIEESFRRFVRAILRNPRV
ncbi:MAG: hypothetical protein EDX89_24385 [Acidobacteria bacterium]|nr:MAG: hypothetical protein EDX89_24385 [Acidobacteriota bacterium]